MNGLHCIIGCEPFCVCVREDADVDRAASSSSFLPDSYRTLFALVPPPTLESQSDKVSPVVVEHVRSNVVGPA